MSHLSRHILAIHRGIRRFSCDSCEKMFFDKRDLRRHVDEVANGSIDIDEMLSRKRLP
jgi:RNase P subunit RPR2